MRLNLLGSCHDIKAKYVSKLVLIYLNKDKEHVECSVLCNIASIRVARVSKAKDSLGAGSKKSKKLFELDWQQ